MHDDPDPTHPFPISPLADFTVIHDRRSNQLVARIQGVLVLPVGAEIELLDPNLNAKVVRVRLLAGAGGYPPGVCLDVEVPDEYWAVRESRSV